MKSIANCISIARIIFVLLLIFTSPLSLEFYMIYFLCGISDILDGYIARKKNIESRLGEKLDSLADLIMVVVLMIIIYPIIDISVKFHYWAAGIAAVRVISIITAFIKYKTFGMLHTFGNKIAGLMLFLFPLTIKSNIYLYLLCIVGSLSAIEELIIHLISKELDVNRKSMVFKNHP